MIEQTINRLSYLVDKAPGLLSKISEKEWSAKSSPSKWSKKEILGHLIDSATNNHQRFVRGQFELIPEILYDQNKWNECSFHQKIESKQLIDFWTIYQKQLIEIMQRIPREKLAKQIRIGENVLTLEFLIIDYVEHLEHHLAQLIAY